MSTLNRHIVALEMLHQDMQDRLGSRNESNADAAIAMEDAYLKLLSQYAKTCQDLLESADDLTERHFAERMKENPHTAHLTSRRMLEVQIRLLQFVADFYAANNKVLAIRVDDFGSGADVRLELLQTKAIRAKNQFKTVVQAMGAEEYQTLMVNLALPANDWGWQKLGLGH